MCIRDSLFAVTVCWLRLLPMRACDPLACSRGAPTSPRFVATATLPPDGGARAKAGAKDSDGGEDRWTSSEILGTRQEILRKRYGFHYTLLTPVRPSITVSIVRKAEAPRALRRGPMEGPQGRSGRPDHRVRGAVGDRSGGTGTDRGALRGAAVRCRCRVVRHGSAQVRPVPPGTWPQGAGAVSAARLLGAASRPAVDRAAPTWRVDGATGTTASIRHGSSSSSLHRSHSSSIVLWAMANGLATACLT